MTIFVEADDGNCQFSVGRFKPSLNSRSNTSLPKSCILHRFIVGVIILLDKDLIASVCTFPVDCTIPSVPIYSSCIPMLTLQCLEHNICGIDYVELNYSANFYQAKYCVPDPVLGPRDTKMRRK